MTNESLLKIMKMFFILLLKVLFVVKIFNFCLDFLVIQKNSMIKKTRLISTFMTSQPGKGTIAIHIA